MQFIYVSCSWSDWSTRNTRLLLEKVCRNQTKKTSYHYFQRIRECLEKLAKGLNSLARATSIITEQMSLNGVWISLGETGGSFLPPEDQGRQSWHPRHRIQWKTGHFQFFSPGEHQGWWLDSGVFPVVCFLIARQHGYMENIASQINEFLFVTLEIWWYVGDVEHKPSSKQL